MRILITGAAGNLGGMLARHLLQSTDHHLNLMIHRRAVEPDLSASPRVTVYPCDLGNAATLVAACHNSDVIVHFAGVLFAPGPESFLPTTNTQYAKNLMDTAIAQGVKKFILISFPHVEGPTTAEHPCTDRLDGAPISVHAQTRLAEEKYLFQKCVGTSMTPVSLRPGMIYGHDVLMVAFARKLARLRLLGVWRPATEIHVISITDFVVCCQAAIENPAAQGIYPLGDDAPLTLQEFLDRCCDAWHLPHPWRVPLWSVYAVAWCCEQWARLFHTRTPFTLDFIRIGCVPYHCDTRRMKQDLLPTLRYPSLVEGRGVL